MCRCTSYMKCKLSIYNVITKRVAVALKVPLLDIAEKTTEKARDIVIDGKSRRKTQPTRNNMLSYYKIQLLMLELWTWNFIVEYFHVTDYMVIAARSLLATKRIGSKPSERKRKTLSTKPRRLSSIYMMIMKLQESCLVYMAELVLPKFINKISSFYVK
ncbi:unnamed protein product [Clavelina lepadiformis]|uniref:Uncharacterized protein n=1 Tax=Clavelina lepadiformis TaxID=159417 RepID=A0ABP0G408_CLALP